jgi:anaerobic dimethyl sulfoxide reductase subunit B (iron-sulfur subunit)
MQGERKEGLGDPMSQYGFYFDKEKCVGCRACEVACQVWNGSNQTVKWRNVTCLTRGQFPEVTGVNVSLACMHCGDAPCQKACPRQAISKSKETGAVTVDQSKCVGCMLCLWACPFGAPKLSTAGRMEKCTFCRERPMGMKRACEEICPTQAIVSGLIDELAKFSKKNTADRLSYEEAGGVVLGHEGA